MSMDEKNCCERTADIAENYGWDEGAKFMLQSIGELIGNGQYDAEMIWTWVSKEMKKWNFGTWKTDRGILGFHLRVDEK